MLTSKSISVYYNHILNNKTMSEPKTESYYDEYVAKARLTRNNRKLFVQKYGEFDNTALMRIFGRFERIKPTLKNRDIFTYTDFSALRNILMPTDKEKNSVINTRQQNTHGVYEIRSDKTEKVYDLLRLTYGFELLDEDLCDVVKAYAEMVSADYASKSIFGYANMTEFKNDITAFRNKGGSRPIGDVDPEVTESKKLYSDEHLIVYKVECYEDSKHLCHDVGNRASWCISYQGNDTYWKQYTRDRNLEFVFLLLRSGEKFAITMTKDGSTTEVYDTADLLTSCFHLVDKYPQIVKPIRDAGFENFQDRSQYQTTQMDGFVEVQEVITGELGGGSRVSVTSRIDETGNYLDMDKHGTYGMVVEDNC